MGVKIAFGVKFLSEIGVKIAFGVKFLRNGVNFLRKWKLTSLRLVEELASFRKQNNRLVFFIISLFRYSRILHSLFFILHLFRLLVFLSSCLLSSSLAFSLPVFKHLLNRNSSLWLLVVSTYGASESLFQIFGEGVAHQLACLFQ